MGRCHTERKKKNSIQSISSRVKKRKNFGGGSTSFLLLILLDLFLFLPETPVSAHVYPLAVSSGMRLPLGHNIIAEKKIFCGKTC